MSRNETRLSSLRAYLNTITIEPVLFLSQLAASLVNETIQNLSLFKICHLKFGYSKNVCLHALNETIEHEVQSIEIKYTLYRSYAEWIPIVIVTLLLGAWSDAHGRKMPMLLAKTGFLVTAIIQLSVAIFDKLPAETLFASSIVHGLTGGNMVFTVAALSYIADLSSRRWRTSRFAFLDASRFLAAPLGLAFAGYAYRNWGFIPILSIVVVIRFICLVYLCWRLQNLIPAKESEQPREDDLPKEKEEVHVNWFKKMYRHLMDCGRVCFKQRDGHVRFWILLVLLANWTLSIPGMAEGSVSFLYFREKFQWQQDNYSYYSAISVLFACIGLLIFLPLLSQKANISDPAMELIGNLARVINPLIVGFSTCIWMVWAALPLTTLYAFCFPAMRSFVSKIVPADEYGKIFAVKAASEAIIPIFAIAAYAELYNKTRVTFPSAFLLLSASIAFISVVIFSIIYLDTRRTSDYTVLTQQNDAEINENPEA